MANGVLPWSRLAMVSSNEVPKPSPELRLRLSRRESDSRCESENRFDYELIAPGSAFFSRPDPSRGNTDEAGEWKDAEV
jgi:hypothetical protein